MPQAPPQATLQPPISQEKTNELQAALLTLTNTLTHFMIETRASIRNLESQVGQLARMFNNRPQGTFPSNTIMNPKEQCNAISLRSGKELEEPDKKSILLPKVVDEKKGKVEEVRLQKRTLDKLFSKVLDVIGKLHINIPFAEALEKISSYMNFMKEILSKKRKLEDYETMAITKECSTIIQKKLPPKLKDLSSFIIPCTIGNVVFEKALCDLGISVNLMPLSIYQKLKLGEARPTTIILQMVDRSVKHPRGIIEDVLVKVDKFIFHADFIILDIEEDTNIPIILGRPFLATGRALIDVQKGELKQ
ncbi:uncharacterized protein LOC133778991 [Humulus lupulus]|uniref:uncharacterized protein LOC133778991 n=1 Tax=Humulus lupulus TaxID=3486 RepID=UPI002B4019D6|nr:uncharacterized protein LOC133778991 [Humulus lupulus]